MKSLIIAVILALLATRGAQAGTTGVLNGYARTESGVAVAGAVIKAVSASRQAWTRTDAHGFFTFVDLPPDVYTIAAEKVGYASTALAGTRINSDQTTFFAFTLIRASCGGSAHSVDQRSEDFSSLDLRVLSSYPRPLQFLTPAVPGPVARYGFNCL